jgi:hypothetical protein
MKTPQQRIWQKHRKGRGVAMVEAGILAPIFAMMMMMTVYLGGVYNAKYRSFVKERYYTWYYGSSGCTASIKNSNPDGNATQQQAQQNDPCNQAQGGAQASSSLGMAHAYDAETWDYQPTYKFNNNGPKTVQTDGYMVCNEKATSSSFFGSLGGQLMNWFSQIKGGNSPCN